MNKELKKQLNLEKHYNISDSIPIRTVDSEGVMETRKGLYCKTYALQDVNYSISKMIEKGEMYLEWCNVLNRIDPTQGIQITIHTHDVNIDYIEDDVFLHEVGDNKDYLREAYNDIIKKNMLEGHNNIRKEKYITLSLEANDIIAASQAFVSLESDVTNILRGIDGCDMKPLNTVEKLNLLHNLYNPNKAGEFKEYGSLNGSVVKSFNIENVYLQGVGVADLVQPSSMEFKNRYFKLGDVYCRGIDLIQLPTVMNDQFLSDITNQDFNMILSMHVKQLDARTATNLVENKLTSVNGRLAEKQKNASMSGYSIDLIDPKLDKDREEARELLDDIQGRNQKLFTMKMHILIYANSLEELDKNTEKIMNVANGKLVRFSMANNLQENTLNSTLPYGFDSTNVFRTLTTESLGIFIPFTAQEVIQKSGVYYGINSVTKNIITFDRMTGDNYNSFIFGASGSGKSFTAKSVIMSTFLNSSKDCDIIIIDPQGEYGILCEALGDEAEEIILTGAGEHHINPLDLDENYGENPTADKVSFLQSMCSEMLNSELTPTQKTAVSLAGKSCYAKWNTSHSEKDIPTLEDFYDALIDCFEADGGRDTWIYELIMTVKNYVAGVDTLFQGKTNVDVKKRFIVYNTQKLGKNVQNLAMLVILDSILNRISHNRKLGKPTYFFVDEIHLLFKKGFSSTASWLQMLWKTARKFLGAPCGITQDLEDLLNNDIGRTIISQSSFIIMLKLSQFNRDLLAQELGLSSTQLSYIGSNVARGSGLLYMQASDSLPAGAVVPFKNQVPHDNAIYKLINSTPTQAS